MSLRTRQLACMRGDRTLFNDITLALGPGEALWVRGGNGSGKTSLLRLLCGLASPSEGEVSWHGQPLARVRADFNASLAYIGHANAVKDDLAAWENVAFGAAPGPTVSRAAACDALSSLGLAAQADLPARVLSQGQRKRVALARLQIGPSRPLWILDEPFSALDQGAIATLSASLTRHLQQGGMLVYTTHQPVMLGVAPIVLDLDAQAAHPPC